MIKAIILDFEHQVTTSPQILKPPERLAELTKSKATIYLRCMFKHKLFFSNFTITVMIPNTKSRQNPAGSRKAPTYYYILSNGKTTSNSFHRTVWIISQ